MVPFLSTFQEQRPMGGEKTINVYTGTFTQIYVLLNNYKLYPSTFTAKLPVLFPHGKDQLR